MTNAGEAATEGSHINCSRGMLHERTKRQVEHIEQDRNHALRHQEADKVIEEDRVGFLGGFSLAVLHFL